MLDAVRFEELGLPAAAIVTEPFTTTGRVMAELQGFTDYPFATVPHPVASLSEDQVTALADAVTPAVERLLLSGLGDAPTAAAAGSGTAAGTASDTAPGDVAGASSRDAVGAVGGHLAGSGVGRASLDAIVEALAEGVRADRADLTAEQSGSRIIFRLHIPDEACAECVMPSSMLIPMFRRRIAREFGPGLTVELEDPRDKPV